MDLFEDIVDAIQSDLTIGDESSFLDLDTVKLAANRAYRKAAGLFRWPETEDAKKTSSVSSQEYYDYPVTWRPNSVWKLKLDGTDYGDPMVFKDYLYEQENSNPSGIVQKWANQWRRFFIDPAPTTNGNNNIEVWGQKIVTPMSADSDVTIFSYSMPECNEAIVLEAIAILKNKGEIIQPVARSFIGGTQLLNAEAQNILTVAWSKVASEMKKYEKTQPLFDVPDMFAPRRITVKDSNIGRF